MGSRLRVGVDIFVQLVICLSRLPTARFRSGQVGKGVTKMHPQPPTWHPKAPKSVQNPPKMHPKGSHCDQGTSQKEPCGQVSIWDRRSLKTPDDLGLIFGPKSMFGGGPKLDPKNNQKRSLPFSEPKREEVVFEKVHLSQIPSLFSFIFDSIFCTASEVEKGGKRESKWELKSMTNQ